jgi:hypothetical protein
VDRAPLGGPRARLPWGLIAAVALVSCVEGFVARNAPEFSDPSIEGNRFADLKSAEAAPGCDLLCFGDSQAKFGVAPRIVEARSGMRGYNLAIVGGQPVASFALLRRALDSGARPRAILLDSKANILASDVHWTARNLASLLRPRDAFELAVAAREASLFATLMAGHYLPSIRLRDGVRSAVRHALDGRASGAATTVAGVWRNWSTNAGAMINAPRPAAWGGIHPGEVPIFYSANWRHNPVNTLYLRRFLALARSRGIPVYWLLFPIAPEVQARREQLGLDGAYVQFVLRLQAEFANLKVIDGRHARYERTVLIDSGHLDVRGASAFSTALAEVLRRDRAAPASESRWALLPDYRPAASTLEDMEQSMRLAGRKAGGPR